MKVMENVKSSLQCRAFMKTHFNYVFSQIKQLISDICAFVVLCTLTHRFFFSNNVNFQNLKDVTEAAQLAAQLETNGMCF